MNILITGGAGYIGSIVSEQLLNEQHDIIIIDNLQEGNEKAVLPGTSFYNGDFGDIDILNNIFSKYKIDVVFHFAAETTIEFSMSDPERYFNNNLIKSLTLLNAMRAHKCNKIVFSSTAAVYGEPQYTPIDEGHPKNPINAYGESKLAFERVLSWYNKAYGIKYNTFRYFNAAGASNKLGEYHKHESHLIPMIIKSIFLKSKKSNFVIYGHDYPTKDKTCIRDYVHVLDICSAHILAIKNLDINPTGKYNLGNGEGHSILEVINTLETVVGEKIKYTFGDRRIGDPAILIASSEHAINELGWSPIHSSLKDIIQSSWKWHLKNPDGYKF